MKGFPASLRVCTLICLLMAPPVVTAGLPELIDKIRPGVVGVGTSYPPRQPNVKGDRVVYLATGFVVGDGRHIITNAHVTGLQLDSDNNQTLSVFSGRGVHVTAHPATVVRTDEEHDLVLLEIQGSRLPALQLGDSNSVREGQDIAFTPSRTAAQSPLLLRRRRPRRTRIG